MLDQVGVHPVTVGLSAQTPAPTISIVVSLGKTIPPTSLPVGVRGQGSADGMADLLLSVCPEQGWVQCTFPP